jgi:hypothetical protein
MKGFRLDNGQQINLGRKHSPETRAAWSAQRRKHGHTDHTHQSREYRSWAQARNRVLNPNSKDWPRYGGRGITMAPEFAESFEAFLAYMGPRPAGTSLDRIDNDGNYERGNMRWAISVE